MPDSTLAVERMPGGSLLEEAWMASGNERVSAVVAIPRDEFLSELVEVCRTLRRMLPPEDAVAWLKASHPFLEDASPFDAIAVGHGTRVRSMLSAVEEGAFF